MSLLTLITLLQAAVAGGRPALAPAAIDSAALTQGVQVALKAAVGNVLEVQRPQLVKPDGPIYLSLTGLTDPAAKAKLKLTSLDSLPLKTFGERAKLWDLTEIPAAERGNYHNGVMVGVSQLALQGEKLNVRIMVNWNEQRSGRELIVGGFAEYIVDLVYSTETKRFSLTKMKIGMRT